MRRKKKAPKVPAWLTQPREKLPPAELAEQELLLEALRQGELEFVGKSRGLGPSYALALDYALAGEGAFNQRKTRAVLRKWEQKCRAVSFGSKKGARKKRVQAAESQVQVLAPFADQVGIVERGGWSITHAACVLHEKRGVGKSVSTLRRYIDKSLILNKKFTKNAHSPSAKR